MDQPTARLWRQYDAEERRENESMSQELHARQTALRSIHEVHGKWEGDDYWVGGWNPEETTTDMLTRLRLEQHDDHSHLGSRESIMRILSMHDRTFGGAMSDSNSDDDGSVFSNEDPIFHGPAYDEDGDVNFNDNGAIFVDQRAQNGYRIDDQYDEEPADHPSRLPDLSLLGPASRLTLYAFGDSQTTDFMIAFEALQTIAGQLSEGQALRLRDRALALADDFGIDRKDLGNIFQDVQDLSEPGIGITDWEINRTDWDKPSPQQMDKMWDTIHELEADQQKTISLIHYWSTQLAYERTMWRRSHPEQASKFDEFACAAKLSVQEQFISRPLTLEHAVLCWAIGVLTIPDDIVYCIKRLVRLHYVRTTNQLAILEAKDDAYAVLFRNTPGYIHEQSTSHRLFREYLKTSEGHAALLLQEENARYGYEFQTLRPRKGHLHVGYAVLQVPNPDLPYRRQLDILRASWEVRTVRLAQALRKPQTIAHIAQQSHKTAAVAIGAWVQCCLRWLSINGAEGTAEELADRQTLCEDMISHYTTFQSEKAVRKLIAEAIERQLIPPGSFDDYRGMKIVLSSTAPKDVIAACEDEAAGYLAQIVVADLPDGQHRLWGVYVPGIQIPGAIARCATALPLPAAAEVDVDERGGQRGRRLGR